MKYMGSKNRIAKYIVPILEESFHENGCEIFIDACCGGCNLIDKVSPDIPRYANDINTYIIEMFKAIESGWEPPYVDKNEYDRIRANRESYPPQMVGWAGVGCSYSGKWFGGYAGKVTTKQGERDYIEESIRNVKKQAKMLRGVRFSSKSLFDFKPTKKALIYLDIPYRDTTGYGVKFPHDDFYAWCIRMAANGHKLFISEYNMPDEFKCVWESEVRSSLSANGVVGGSKTSVERLFTLK